MSTFFKNFKETDYHFINESSNNKKKITNILISFLLKKSSTNKSTASQTYSIKDNDTFESLSIEFYGTPYFYWIFLLLNQIIDPFSEWSYSPEIIEKFTEKKYKDGVKLKKNDNTFITIPLTTGINGINHFYNITTDSICDEIDDAYYRTLYQSNPSSIGEHIIPVTNFQYELNKNLERKEILVLSKSHVSKFENDFNKMMAKK